MHLHLGKEGFYSHDIFRDGMARGELEVGPKGDELEVAADALGLGLHLLAEALRLQSIARAEHTLEITVLGEPFHGGLRAHALKSRNIVGSVADEREVVGDPLRRDAELLGDRGRIKATPAHGRVRRRRRSQLDDRSADALAEVLIGADNDACVASLGENSDGGGNQVIGFDAASLEDLEAE